MTAIPVQNFRERGNTMTDAHAFGDSERAAVYRAITERRDVRRGFLDTPLPERSGPSIFCCRR